MKSGEEAHGEFQHEQGTRDNGTSAFEAGKPVTLAAIVLLDMISLSLADVMPPGRQSALARLIIASAIEQDFPGLQSFEQAV
ncbi:MAG: hypothetical protein WBE80_00875 [Methylocella sp.]